MTTPLAYVCSECGARFDFDDAKKAIEREIVEFWGEKSTVARYVDLCPECESDLIEEAPTECKCCGEVPPMEGSDFCPECLEGIATEAEESE